MVLFNFLFLLVVLVIFVGASASDSPSSSSFFLIVSSFLPVAFLFWGVICLLVLLILLIILLLLFHLLCFHLLVTYVVVIIIIIFNPHDFPLVCMHLVWLFLCFLLVPPLSHLLFLLLPKPPRALAKESNGKNKYLILFASGGSLRKCPFKKSLFLSFVDFFCPQNVFWFQALGICFEEVRDSDLLLICCCCFVALVFGTKAFFRSNLSLLPAFFGFVVFSVRAFLIFVFLLVWWFLGSGLFLWNALRHLGIVISSFCPHAASSTSCLGCSFMCVGFWAAFSREPSRGVVWVWPTWSGQYDFSAFLIESECLGENRRCPPGRGFLWRLHCFRITESSVCERRTPFQMRRRKHYKNRDFRIVFGEKKKGNPPYVFNFFIFLWLENILLLVWGGPFSTNRREQWKFVRELFEIFFLKGHVYLKISLLFKTNEKLWFNAF